MLHFIERRCFFTFTAQALPIDQYNKSGARQSFITYKESLTQLNLLPLTYWHEYLDLVFFYKITNNLVSASSSILPSQHSHRSTRSTHDPDLFIFRPAKCRTLTYQHSYLPGICRVWNCLRSVCSFKLVLKRYYKAATEYMTLKILAHGSQYPPVLQAQFTCWGRILLFLSKRKYFLL